MIALTSFKDVTETDKIVLSIHYAPFDERNGFGKTADELTAEGFVLVESLPSEDAPEGHVSELHYNPASGELTYMYIAEKPVDDIAQLQADRDSLMLAVADLYELITTGGN